MVDLSAGHIIAIIIITGFIGLVAIDKFIANKREDRLHRERLAMIERGIVPPPEVNPVKFEQAADAAKAAAMAAVTQPWVVTPGTSAMHPHGQRPNPGHFARALGILIVCAGIGIAALLFTLGETRGAIGIGALVCSIGSAFLIMSMMRPSPPEAGS